MRVSGRTMKNKLQKRIKKALASINGKGYWKWKILPSPVKLGMSDSNALGSRDFGAQPGQPTWEDWEEKVKIMHPIRFFLIEELGPWIKRTYRTYIWEPWYWLKCHAMKKHRYHMLDLRQPKIKGEHSYRYGWCDSDTQILFALFNILNNFVEHEMSDWFCPSDEEIAVEPALMDQRNKYLEVKAIHYWWNIDRKRRDEKHSELLSQWHAAKQANDPKESQLWQELKKDEESNKDKEDEMMARLLKIRRSLWT